MSDAVYNWDRVVHKNVRSSDGADVGTIIQVAGDKVRIMLGTNNQYEVPKSTVEGFDGSEVQLSVPYAQIGQYKVE
jgi:hypothetical protein